MRRPDRFTSFYLGSGLHIIYTYREQCTYVVECSVTLKIFNFSYIVTSLKGVPGGSRAITEYSVQDYKEIGCESLLLFLKPKA